MQWNPCLIQRSTIALNKPFSQNILIYISIPWHRLQQSLPGLHNADSTNKTLRENSIATCMHGHECLMNSHSCRASFPKLALSPNSPLGKPAESTRGNILVSGVIPDVCNHVIRLLLLPNQCKSIKYKACTITGRGFNDRSLLRALCLQHDYRTCRACLLLQGL